MSPRSLIVKMTVLVLPSVALDKTASIAGQVFDMTGAAIAGATAELLSESSPVLTVRTKADETGVYRFSEVAEGVYTLKLSAPGFRMLTIKSVSATPNRAHVLPSLRLSVAGNCEPGAVLNYIRILDSETQNGNVGGIVRLDGGPMNGNTPPVAEAEVALIGERLASETTKTDGNGLFIFKNIAEGEYKIRVTHAGFYPVEVAGYRVHRRFEYVYSPAYMELCRGGNCDPRRRPKKAPAVCE